MKEYWATLKKRILFIIIVHLRIKWKYYFEKYYFKAHF